MQEMVTGSDRYGHQFDRCVDHTTYQRYKFRTATSHIQGMYVKRLHGIPRYVPEGRWRGMCESNVGTESRMSKQSKEK